jgi:TRAP-type mannitol/chloroaromatic compound transport system permease small subunit
MPFMSRFISVIDWVTDGIGRAISFLVYPMIGVLVWEVLMRYLFNHPTIWAHELSALLYAVFFLIGGAYTLRWRAHINVDVLYARLSPRSRAVLDLVTWLLFYFFCSVLLWQGSQAAWKSFLRLERASTVWEPYVWPVKFCIPLAALLMLLQGFTKTISDLYLIFTGRQMPSMDESGTRP